jgi:putative PIN family toxin of toxin-antitoxin system
MRAVIDTNVIVSGMLNGAGTPGKIVDAVLRGEITVVHSDLILDEYREVLHRGKFAFNLADIRAFLDAVESDGEFVALVASTMPLPDPKDRPFMDVALYAACPVVTGNGKHFPASTGVNTLSPAEAIALL